jgi:FKBP-type peptidyl-prolyl cis-trans isomerase FkpA/FKBP-type peptidyl-prolyl cis-trans isomerase FklB
MRTAVAWSVALVLLGATGTGAAAAELQTDEQKTLYALGLALSQNLGVFHLSEAELAFVSAGIADGVLHKKPEVDMQTYGPKVQQLYSARMTQVADTEKKAGLAFADKAAHADGAKKTPSGLVISTIKPGAGATPKPTDTVKVHYHGTLIDGTVFDSSVKRGEPATFPLNGVIKCWSEALPLMKVGGKSRLVCPSGLAYGDRGHPPRIMPGATLVFEVELLEIVTK